MGFSRSLTPPHSLGIRTNYKGVTDSTKNVETVTCKLETNACFIHRTVPNHFEHACNALDGQRVGAGIATDTFDLPKLR